MMSAAGPRIVERGLPASRAAGLQLRCGLFLLSAVLLACPSTGKAARRDGGQNCLKSAYRDGCSGAGDGGALFPELLDQYAAPPPWNVAGIHYAVGVSEGATLNDPRIAPLPQGCSLSGVVVTCAGTVTLDGYDFSLHDGTTLLVTGGDVTVRNCLFVVGPNQGDLGRIIDVRGRTNATFVGNEFDGADIPVIPQRGQMINVINAGKITFEYNHFHNSGGDMIDFGGGPQVAMVQYNLFRNIGLKTAHSDTLQWCGSTVVNSDLSFNTIVQSKPGLSGMGLLTLNSECEGAKMSNILAHNNTLISEVRDNFAVGADVMQNAGPAVADHVAVFDNYVDPTGIEKFTGSPWFPTGFYNGTLPRPTALHSLIDMRSGRIIEPAIRAAVTAESPLYYVYPDAAGYKPALSDVYSISAFPASGVSSVGQTITFVLEMDEPWDVIGRPKLSLNTGGHAYYAAGSGTRKLAFIYHVRDGEHAADLAVVSVEVKGGTIKDAFGNNANMNGAITTFVGLSVQ